MQRKFTGTTDDDSTIAQRIIAAEIPGIVSRALNYALPALTSNRIKACPSGEEILKEWRIGDNAMLAWLHSSNVLRVGGPTKASDLFAHYKKFCLETGSEPGSQKKFSMRLRDQGYEPEVQKDGTYYGIGLLTGPQIEPPEDDDVRVDLRSLGFKS
jgi:hypothetical protein